MRANPRKDRGWASLCPVPFAPILWLILCPGFDRRIGRLSSLGLPPVTAKGKVRGYTPSVTWEEMPKYNPPPNWPAPPPGWTPPAGWKSPANWPPPPKGWNFWLPDEKDGSWFGRHKTPDQRRAGAGGAVLFIVTFASGGDDPSAERGRHADLEPLRRPLLRRRRRQSPASRSRSRAPSEGGSQRAAVPSSSTSP